MRYDNAYYSDEMFYEDHKPYYVYLDENINMELRDLNNYIIILKTYDIDYETAVNLLDNTGEKLCVDGSYEII